MIEEMRAEGRTIFVNSHLLAEVEQVADHVAILANGRVIETGTVAELTRRGSRYEVRTVGPVPPPIREGLEREGLVVKGDLIAIAADDATPVQPVIDLLRGAGVGIREIREAKLSLEDLFLQVVQAGKEAA
jgi:ABC-2 type transport system ATP-binding protein